MLNFPAAEPLGIVQESASNCGGEGQPCCSSGPVSRHDANIYLCPAGYSEGADQSLICDIDLELDETSCIACGKVNQPCCRASGISKFTCDDGNACASGVCKTCGALNQTCCSSGPVSIRDANIDLCPAGYSEGADQSLICDIELDETSCVACGKVNQPCCRASGISTFTCDTGNACASEVCETCGGLGQPCCPDDDEECLAVPDGPRLACSGSGPGTCLACGAAGQPCCQGGTAPPCSAGTTCGEEGTCEECGRLGEPCCSETSDLLTQCVYAGVVLLLDHPSAAS